ncbi:MAG TPA: TlpA disulfide reductase family protein [Solirubrobacterales bacterium]|nr:TlpA disulfide reductase family protein [Solirubrobacterales bacterium]
MENGAGRDGGKGPEQGQGPRRTTIYSLIVGMVFVALIAIAGINTIATKNKGVLGATNEGDMPIAQFAVPNARTGASGDANIAQDDCDAARIPCPSGSRRTPACRVDVPGALRVCDYFGRPLVLSFWFTRGGDCENQEDVFERAYRKYRDRVNFLAIDVRDSSSEVQKLIRDHHWTHPVGLDRDGALSNLFRVGGCPTFVYAYPGGIFQATSIGRLDDPQFFAKVDALIAASKKRAATVR